MATQTVRPRDRDLPTSFTSQQSYEKTYPRGAARSDDDRKKYAAYARALWDEQEEYMATLHQVWQQNLLFFSGRHWWTRGTDGVYRPRRVPSWREQPVTNLTLAFFRNYLAKVLKNRPAWTVIAATPDPEDTHAAELGDQVLEAKWQELMLSEILKQATSWAITTGNGYLYPYWNSHTGRMVRAEVMLDCPVYDPDGTVVGEEELPVLLDRTGNPQLLANGRPDPAAKPVMVDEGDVGVRAYSPFQVRVNPEAENDNDLTWVIIGEVRTIRDLALQYPEESRKVMPEGVDLTVQHDRAMSAIGTLAGEAGLRLTPVRDTRAEHLEKALVLHYHEKPCTDYPGGRYWVCTRDAVLVEPQELPEGVWPPVIHLTDVTMPGRYHASSVMEAIVPLNRHYNEINAAIKEHHNLMAKGKWLVPRGSGIKVGVITNAPGEVIQFNPGFKPEQAVIAPLPQTIIEERARVFSDWEMVGGQHRVSMGKAPPGVSAGVAFLQLQEADDTDLGPFLTMLETNVARLAGSILQIIKARYTTERLVYVVGENRRYQARAFKGADLRGAIDVRPQTGSSFPWSRTAQQSMLLSLAAQMPQLFTDAETGMFDAAKFARLLPIGGLGSIGNESDLDVQEALREEDMFAEYGVSGRELPEVGFWQNHDVHYRQHVRVLKSAEFRSWPPEAQEAFMKHVQQTQQERDAKAVQSAQMNAMAQGNAPKELYQQGGPQGGGQPMTPEDLAGMSEDELAVLEGLPTPPWLEDQMGEVPQPAEAGGLDAFM